MNKRKIVKAAKGKTFWQRQKDGFSNLLKHLVKLSIAFLIPILMLIFSKLITDVLHFPSKISDMINITFSLIALIFNVVFAMIVCFESSSNKRIIKLNFYPFN